MKQKVETRKKILKVAIWVVVILALTATAHILVNNFDGLNAIKALHGG
jgi:hypothetical protein